MENGLNVKKFWGLWTIHSNFAENKLSYLFQFLNKCDCDLLLGYRYRRRVHMHSCGSKQNIDDKPWNVIAYRTLLQQNSENSSQISTKKSKQRLIFFHE